MRSYVETNVLYRGSRTTRTDHLKTAKEHGFDFAPIDILDGEKGPKRDVVLLNSSAALVSADMAKDFKEGIKIAEDSIDSGKAKLKLEELVNFTRENG